MEAPIAGVSRLKFATLLRERQSAERKRPIKCGFPANLVRARGVGEAGTRKLNGWTEAGVWSRESRSGY